MCCVLAAVVLGEIPMLMDNLVVVAKVVKDFTSKYAATEEKHDQAEFEREQADGVVQILAIRVRQELAGRGDVHQHLAEVRAIRTFALRVRHELLVHVLPRLAADLQLVERLHEDAARAPTALRSLFPRAAGSSGAEFESSARLTPPSESSATAQRP